MAALELDIKLTNDLETMALKTAKALDDVAEREKKVNAMLDKGVQLGTLSDEVAKRARDHMAKHKKQILDQAAKDLVLGKKKNEDIKQQSSFADKLAKHYLMVRDAIMVAWRAAKAMTIDLISGGRKTAKELASVKYELNQWSGSKGAEQFAEIDKFAKATNISVAEASRQWLKFRQASTSTRVIGNQEAMDLLKVWADIKAISQSTEQADKQMDEYIQKIGEGPAVAAAFLKQLQETTDKGVVGTGEIAKSMKDIGQGADDAFENSVTRLEKLFNDKFGGVVDKIKVMLAGMLDKLTNSKAFNNFLDQVRKDAEWLIRKFPDLIKFVGDFWSIVNEVNEDIGKKGIAWIEKISSVFSSIASAVTTSSEAVRKMLGIEIKDPNSLQPLNDKPVFKNKIVEQQKTEPSAFQKTADEPNRLEPVTPTQTTPVQPVQHQEKQKTPSAIDKKKTASIIIQNLNVTGGGNPEQVARSVRQELQLLLQAGALSRGLA